VKRGVPLLFALALAGFAPGAHAQSPDARCMEELQQASNACGKINAPQIGECMSEKAGGDCVKQFEGGKADAICQQRVQDAITPCADRVRPALMKCLAERASPQCMEQSGISGKAAK